MRLERAVHRFRLQSAHNLLDEAFASVPPEAFVRDVGRPLLMRLDDAAELRFARSLLELRLLAQAQGWERVHGPLVVLACAPSDDDVLELIAIGIALADRHCRIAYLGAATPVDALAEAVRRQDTAAVVLAAERGALTRRDGAELRALPCPLVVIGTARAALAKATDGVALDAEAVTAPARIAGLARRQSSRRSDEPSPT
ncbi:hypothetical protein OJ997_24260 [Solirubrobacter phytolaccae]|uniref:B12-binding domain-containing protein n=1 Tax=Solirubrobacter phytolaccae TaxID=1404360 RepID=A0A9X3NBA3_9ACTN|nr:hypothetical protein [Solirubrobacter phytolaccae]MDA0183445.1 hypothetical protein [Solirubrobacter phytolaccae]